MIYFYLMVFFMIVIGMVWKWILNSGLGFEVMVCGWGFENFIFDWFVNLDMVIYMVVIVVIW